MKIGMKQSEKEKLSEKELLFCRCYVAAGDSKEAALRAGYGVLSARMGVKLLGRESIRAEIERQYEQQRRSYRSRACSGYERLAFGNTADAVRLLYMEAPDTAALEKMDFFNIAEIKRPKDGAMEIKFFDRLRALEKLEQAAMPNGGETAPFYKALEAGVKALQLKDGEE